MEEVDTGAAQVMLAPGRIFRGLPITLLVMGCMAGRGPDLRTHEQEFSDLAVALRELATVSEIRGVIAIDDTVQFASDSEQHLSSSDTRDVVPRRQWPLLERIEKLVRPLVLSAYVEVDGTVVFLTWTAGTPAGGGYAVVGDGGEATLEQVEGLDWYDPVAGLQGWYVWGT